MTVKELINQLQKFEPDTEVWLTATTRKGIRPTQRLTISSNVTTAVLRRT